MSARDSSKIPLNFDRRTPEEMESASRAMLERYQSRRTVRHFSKDPLPMDVVERCVLAAGTAPSGAHKQPWFFCVITDSKVKKQIREAAEKEEYANYNGRMSERWLKDLAPFDTNHRKPHLEDAPALIAVFRQAWQPDESEGKKQNYYVQESVGIACGMLLSALHESGIAALTHTPSPMSFLCDILDRPPHEKAYLLLPIGYPAKDCEVPDIARKSLADISEKFDSTTK
jgi:iodotyrosine deiodinase